MRSLPLVFSSFVLRLCCNDVCAELPSYRGGPVRLASLCLLRSQAKAKDVAPKQIQYPSLRETPGKEAPPSSKRPSAVQSLSKVSPHACVCALFLEIVFIILSKGSCFRGYNLAICPVITLTCVLVRCPGLSYGKSTSPMPFCMRRPTQFIRLIDNRSMRRRARDRARPEAVHLAEQRMLLGVFAFPEFVIGLALYPSMMILFPYICFVFLR